MALTSGSAGSNIGFNSHRFQAREIIAKQLKGRGISPGDHSKQALDFIRGRGKFSGNLRRQERALRTHVEVLLRDDMRQVGLMQPDAEEERLARPLDPNTRPREVADGLHSKRRNLAVRMFKIGDVL